MKKLERLKKAMNINSQNKIARALIFFETPNPTIAESVNRAVQLAAVDVYSEGTNMCEVEAAVKARRDRLGDNLWFSRY